MRSTNPGIQSFDYTVDLLQSILWQYDNAPNIIALISAKQAWYDANQTEFWLDYYNNIFNLVTANLFGLSVWSYILNTPLLVEDTPDDVNKPLWGFNAFDPSFPDYENTYGNFNPNYNQPFPSGGNFSSRGGNYSLTEEEQRLVLRIRAYQITSSGNIWDINAFFAYLFATSPAFTGDMITVLDGLDMTITYVFNFVPSWGLSTYLIEYDILPRPAGVGIKYVIYPTSGVYFGFNQRISFTTPPYTPIFENNYSNFGNGGFHPS